MSKSLNKVMLIGNVGKDVELKYTPNGVAIATFSMATTESWKDAEGNPQEKTEWHNVTAWRKLAEICAEWVKKGSKIYIEGKLQTDMREKEGQKHYATKIIADQLVMLGGKQSESTTVQTVSQDAPKDDDPLPF